MFKCLKLNNYLICKLYQSFYFKKYQHNFTYIDNISVIYNINYVYYC